MAAREPFNDGSTGGDDGGSNAGGGGGDASDDDRPELSEVGGGGPRDPTTRGDDDDEFRVADNDNSDDRDPNNDRDYPNPLEGDDPARGSAADGSSSGSDDDDGSRTYVADIDDDDRQRAIEQREAEERVEELDPTDPDSPGGASVGRRETERYLAAAAEENVAIQNLEERPALASQVENLTGVDARTVTRDRTDDEVNVQLDPAEGELRVQETASATSDAERPLERQRPQQRQSGAVSSERNPRGETTATTAPQGGDVRLLIESQRRSPQGGDVRLAAASRDRRGVAGGDVRLAAAADDDRRPIDQDRVSELVARFERETGTDIPGDGPVTEPARRGEQFGDFEGGLLGQVDRAAADLASGAQETLTEAYAREAQRDAPGASVGTPIALSPDRLFSGTSGRLAEGAAQGAASITAGAPQTVVEASEFVVGGAQGEFGSEEVQQAAVNRAVQAGEGAATNPTQFAGSIAGSTVASVGAIGAAQRLGGPRAGRAVSTAIQPGEEAAAAAARAGVVSSRTAARVPGVSEAQATARGGSASTSTETTRRLRRGVREARARVSEAATRAPDVTLTRDPTSGPIDVDPLLGQQARNAVRDRRPSRPTTPGDGLRVEVARFRRSLSEARRGARAEARRRASAIAPDRDSLSPDASVPTALQNPTGTARQAAARTQRTLSEGVRDVRAETRRRASALAAETSAPRPSLSVGDGLRVEAARLRRGISEARRDARAEGRRRVSELRESVTSRPDIDGPVLGGAADTTTADVFGRPARTRQAVADVGAGVAGVGERVRDAPSGLRARLSSATPQRPRSGLSLDGAADTTTADVFGRPRQTQATADRLSSGLRRAGDRIRSLGDDSVTTPALPRPGELTLRIGPARPARVDVGDVEGQDIGYDLGADVPDEFRPGENLVDDGPPSIDSGGGRGSADGPSIGGTADAGGGQQVMFRGGRRGGGDVDAGPLASDSAADRAPSRVFGRGEPQTPDAPSDAPAVSQPDVSGVGTGIDIGGVFGADAAGRPELSTDVDVGPGSEFDRGEDSGLEPGRETRLDPGREFDFGRETRTEVPRRTEIATEVEERQELRREIKPEAPTETRRERTRFDGLQPEPGEEAAAIDDGGDEARFEFSTRGLL